MKDEDFFLYTDFNKINLIGVKEMLEDNGWIIRFNWNKGKLKIYEDDFDYNHKQVMTESKGDDFDECFRQCLINIQNYYKRVTA